MHTKGTHIIQRQVFELSAASSKMNFEWDKRAAHFLQDIIKPCIEACFDELSPQARHLVIDKLEIDLGVFATGEFEREGYGRLMETLRKQLRELMATHMPDGMNELPEALSETALKNSEHVFGDQQKKKPSVQHLSASMATQQVLLGFLASGHFPWWHKMHGHPQHLDEHFSLAWMETLQERGKAMLKEILQTSAAARIRLSNHFSAEWIGGCLQLLDMKGEEGRQQYHLLQPATASFPSLQSLFRQHFWLMWMEKAGSISLPELLEATAGGRNAFSREMAVVVLPLCIDHAIMSAHIASLREYLQQQTAPGTTEAADPGSIVDKQGNIIGGKMQKGKKEDDETLVQQVLAGIAQQSLQRKKPGEIPAEEHAIFVQAAGLVLLHPFLAELFRETGLREGEEWCTPQSPFRALQLLSWLAFGETGLHEYRLVFLKILTGIDVETPVPAEAPLTDEEMTACRELLEAVIRHWNALRSTSPGGLQEGFLQREGKLLPAGDSYLLHVEPQAQDVLLSRLPWGYAVVKLPWMKQMLHVTWI
ncbi:contractile injection system tape measure protein [Chitinophaga sp. XS-30]|uniref:contractile injection system tape measure protein n=1 Tax=Chitinophaga sp. XS-30 TaxID=2604421 RepID=UPI0011DDDF43|nr:contractile injection system tape measure protein [Chitinophaga sp. XS-30]QEH43686.1 hypothetical protein FW415_23650 [Chitinophaga sp. XS-30]